MATTPVELDEDLVARVREVAPGDVRSFIEAAIRDELDNVAFGRLLEELDAERGPVPEELKAEAERFWQGS